MATTNWTIDPSHSEIGFKVKHLMITNVKGVFNEFKGDVTSSPFGFATALVNAVIDPGSVSTGSSDRDKHLKSPDFFDVEKYNEITFRSGDLKQQEGDKYVLTGELTIKGITNKITLSVEFNGLMKDPWGNEKAGFSLNGKINRRDWGLNWNAALETGGVLVGEEVIINAEVQLIKV
ncbi:MAG: YceI family protein [Bacteroidota bacterium]